MVCILVNIKLLIDLIVLLTTKMIDYHANYEPSTPKHIPFFLRRKFFYYNGGMYHLCYGTNNKACNKINN